ncbi:MAG TPA: site-2 protease family protein [Acidimicrobiales bacterium]
MAVETGAPDDDAVPAPSGRCQGGRRRFSVRVGSLAGIDIRVHGTFLVLLALVAVASTAPDSPGPVSAILWLVALFGCVTLHELAHSVVARRHDIPIVEIELLPIGGISKMARMPEDPAVELRIAAAGPVMSLALAALFAAAAVVAGASLWPPTLYDGDILVRLAWVNLLLAGFNLLPALPLDGGRVFRAALEERWDRDRATHVAVRVSRVFAVLMIVAGFVLNVWLLLIGAFVYVGSVAEEAAAEAHALIQDLRVRVVMHQDPLRLPAEATAVDVVAKLGARGHEVFPVVTAHGTYVGLVTEVQLARAPTGARVGEIADADAPVLGPDDLVEASGLLDGGVDAAAVVQAGRVVGMARAADAELAVRHLVRRPASIPPPPPPPLPARSTRR